jgi:hypothetical protein
MPQSLRGIIVRVWEDGEEIVITEEAVGSFRCLRECAFRMTKLPLVQVRDCAVVRRKAGRHHARAAATASGKLAPRIDHAS